MIRVLLLALLVLAGAALADEDHERARRALERSEVLPLAELMPEVEARLGGRVIEVEYKRRHGRHLYEFELIAPDGHVLEAYVDAATGEILKVEAEDD